MTRRPRLQIRSLELGTTQIPWTTSIAHAGIRDRKSTPNNSGLLRVVVLEDLYQQVRISKDDTSQIPENGESGLGFRDATNFDQKVSSSFVNCGTSIRFAIKA
jgi:hypothetical protein